MSDMHLFCRVWGRVVYYHFFAVVKFASRRSLRIQDRQPKLLLVLHRNQEKTLSHQPTSGQELWDLPLKPLRRQGLRWPGSRQSGGLPGALEDQNHWEIRPFFRILLREIQFLWQGGTKYPYFKTICFYVIDFNCLLKKQPLQSLETARIFVKFVRA